MAVLARGRRVGSILMCPSESNDLMKSLLFVGRYHRNGEGAAANHSFINGRALAPQAVFWLTTHPETWGSAVVPQPVRFRGRNRRNLYMGEKQSPHSGIPQPNDSTFDVLNLPLRHQLASHPEPSGELPIPTASWSTIVSSS